MGCKGSKAKKPQAAKPVEQTAATTTNNATKNQGPSPQEIAYNKIKTAHETVNAIDRSNAKKFFTQTFL